MGSHKTLGVDEESFKIREGFHKWFLEIESKLFEDYSSNDEDEEDQQKRRTERVKKFMTWFSDSDILLELAEDERNGTNFICENNPIEAFSVLGALAFFNSYVNPSSVVAESQDLNSVITFLDKYKSSKNANTDYLDGMNSVLKALKDHFGQSSKCHQKGGINGESLPGESPRKEIPVIFTCIKSHFLQGFRDPLLLTNIQQLFDNNDTTSTDDAEWNLQQYNVQRLFRFHKYSQTTDNKLAIEDLKDEKIALEAAIRIRKDASKSPRLLLAKCQFLCDFVACYGSSNLEFLDEKFDTHTEIVAFIKECAQAITKDHPSFLRANFTFADIFANELPITKQDREFAKSLLIKSLNANPTSSKINHKMGLFLIKSRQFSEASNYLQRAAQLDPYSAQAYQSLVKLLLRDPLTNKEKLEDFFNIQYPQLIEILGPENELGFWRGCYLFKTGEPEPAINAWTETILEFYVTKPELDLETVLPFKSLINVSKQFLWTKSNLTLENVKEAVKNASRQEKSRRRVVFHRLLDLVNDAII